MKSISIEKRQLIIIAKERKEKQADIARWLNISTQAVKSIWSLYKKTGSIEPKVHTGRKSSLTLELEKAIHRKIQNEPDATLQEIKDDLKLPIEKSQLSRWLIKNGYRLKKNYICQQCPKDRCCRTTSKME